MKNLPPFYIGQTVEYTTGISMPKGTIVKVLDIKKSSCGCWGIRIEKESNHIRNNYGESITYLCCNVCNKREPINKINDWGFWNAKSFKAVQELPFPSLTYKKVVEKESELISLN